jgi:hypothetical protein
MLKSNFEKFNIEPYCEKDKFLIRANIVLLDGRNAPLKMTLVNGKEFNTIEYSVESLIGRSTNSKLRKINIKASIRQSLEELDMDLIENNDFLLARKRLSLDEPLTTQLEMIEFLLKVADELELKYIGGDEEEF